jgi:hypothetical protein
LTQDLHRVGLFGAEVELEWSIETGADAAVIRAFEEFQYIPAEASEQNARTK